MDIMGKLVKNIISTTYDDIPKEMIDLTNKCVLDTLGVSLAATSSAEGKIVTDLVKEFGGKEESSIINHGFKVPAHHAALANSTMARVVDMDDIHERASLHVHVSIIPTALSFAERIGGVSGKDFLTAVVLGADLLCRMGLANKVPTGISGMNSSYQYGAFGVTATCGKLLGLDENRLWNAMGIVYSMTSGNSQCLTEGAMTTRLGQGTCAQAGVLSVLLAQKGFTGVKNVFQGKFGYINCYQKGQYNVDTLTDELGKRFEGFDVTFKRYACCAHTHAAMEGTLDLLATHAIKPEEIQEIHVGVNQQAYNLVVEPVDVKLDPREIPAAQFSIPYTQGSIVLRKKAFIDDFTEREIRNPDVLEIAKKVKGYVDPDIEKAASGRASPAKVTIVTDSGKKFNKRVEYFRGSPNNPFSMDEIVNKFKMCSGFAKNPLSQSRIDEVIDKVNKLEKLTDVNQFTHLFG